jgi:hypothetical protein
MVFLFCYLQRMQSRVTKKKPVANVKAQCLSNALDMSVSKQGKVDKAEQNPLLLEVKILNCLSPSCIYVSLLTQEEQMNK